MGGLRWPRLRDFSVGWRDLLCAVPASTYLAPPFPNHIQDECEQKAQQDGGGQWKVEGCVLAAVEDVSWEAAQREVQSAHNEQEDSGEEECGAEKDQKFGEVGHEGGAEAPFILATLRGAEAPFFHGVHRTHFHSDVA